ncbi:MAG: DUF4262 domain-containing protein [Alteromonadaceae bacterium]|nr:DUF4262 domain-containing protein [Alteromonadaceae bacterium]
MNSKISKNIKTHGWQFQYVFDENEKLPSFAYSIGFEESYSHPEIMIFGLSKDVMHSLLSNLASDIKNGVSFRSNEKVKDILNGNFEVMFKRMKPEFLSEYAGAAKDYYQKPFEVLVMLWPDKNNVLPCEQDCQLTVQGEAVKVV